MVRAPLGLSSNASPVLKPDTHIRCRSTSIEWKVCDRAVATRRLRIARRLWWQRPNAVLGIARWANDDVDSKRHPVYGLNGDAKELAF